MKKTLLTLLTFICVGCVTTNRSAQTVVLTNNTGSDRVDEAFVIQREQFKNAKAGLLPALKNEQGEWVACQADDLDKDGQWDELVFVYSLRQGEKAKLSVEWVDAQDYPQFTPRTNVRYGKMTAPGKIEILPTDVLGKYKLPRGEGYPYQTDGPAWENDKMGFRHYFDGRNVRDVFGKRTDRMVMDSVGIRPDGTPGDTYHVMDWWGRDIMSGASSFGLGGVALQTPDSLIRLGVPIEETTNNIDSTRYTLMVNGPVRSIFKLDFYGWDIYGEKVNVYETMTIWAGKYGYENRIKTTPLPKATHLVTGIVNNFNDRPYTQEKVGRFEIMSTHDKQTYDKVWYMGMSVLIDEENWTNQLLEAPKTGNGITTTWYTLLKPDKQGEYRWNCCAAWEITDERFADKDFYINMIREYSNELSTKVTVKVVNNTLF